MPKVKFVARDFMGMVANLPAAKVDTLYESHWTCQAVFRSLPPLAKMYVLRLLYLEVAVVGKLMEEWILPDYHAKHRVAMDRLEQLRVLLLASEGKRDPSYKLNPKFQKQLRQALTSGGGPPREPLSSNIAVRLPSAAELDSYAMKQWEGVLLQLVSTAFPESSHDHPHDRFVVQTFQRAGLLDSGTGLAKLTEAGFQFLLMDTNYQLWQIIREYISAAEDRGINNVELIRFLLELGFHVVGEPYNRNTLTGTEQMVLEEIAVLGLVQVQQGMKERWFIPTKLAANLATSLSEVTSQRPSEGFLIIETNFRLYAYTASKLQIQILRLFARIEYQLPNLTVGIINKESVNTAFASGITAEQIMCRGLHLHRKTLDHTIGKSWVENNLQGFEVGRGTRTCKCTLSPSCSRMLILMLHRRCPLFQKQCRIRFDYGRVTAIECSMSLLVSMMIFHQRKFLSLYVCMLGIGVGLSGRTTPNEDLWSVLICMKRYVHISGNKVLYHLKRNDWIGNYILY